MNDASTPESDATTHTDLNGLSWVRLSISRKIERERNEALRRERVLQERVRDLENLVGYDPTESGR